MAQERAAMSRPAGLSPAERSRLDEAGAVMVRGCVEAETLAPALTGFAQARSDGPGLRLFTAPPALRGVLAPDGVLGAIAASALSIKARPTRLILFDKNAEANWAVAWHQDRTIAVAEKREAPGYEVWSRKGGVHHVEPPFDIIERTVSLRLHLDDAGPENAPLLTLRGSHAVGKIAASNALRLARDGDVETHIAAVGDLLVLRTAILHASHRALKPSGRRVLHVDFSDAALPHGLAWAFHWDTANV